ncbi:hypothetical protein Salat_1789600 [Sesamum alatum]|uniref:Uncharacterized protein n=1 Tax=Sesamum alatum TaxID=300844 RepID=A0AAE1YA08_9LAMI|nr:hypothetical protein Salat_1789600 [Sesamum alatum]
MEEFDDDDFSDLYADVEVQASSAISALRGLKEMPPGENGSREEDGYGFYEQAIGGENVERADEEDGGGLTKLPMENGDICESGSEDMDILPDDDIDGNKQKLDDECDNGKYDNRCSNIEFGISNAREREGGQGIEEDGKKHGRTDGNKESLSGGEYDSRSKNFKDNSLNSKKRRVDEMACQAHKPSKNGDNELDDDRDLYFSSGSEDDSPNFGRNDEGEIASERVSRHPHVRDPVSLDFDKYGILQISDSVEDNHHEVSDCESDGMTEAMGTSDDMSRRTASSMYKKLQSAVEPKSSPRAWSWHCPSSSRSPSPCAAPSDHDNGKNHKHPKRPSSRLVHELEEATTRRYHSPGDSKSHNTRPSTRNGRSRQRRRSPTRQHKRSNNMPDVKTHLTDEDAPYPIDAKGLYDRHSSHGRRRTMIDFGYKKDIPRSNQAETLFSSGSGFVPDYHLAPAYSKKQYRKAHSSFGCQTGWSDSDNISGRQNFLERKRSKMDYVASEADWFRNWRHTVRGDIEDSRKLIPIYSSAAVTRRDTPFSVKGDTMQFRRRIERDYLSPLPDYINRPPKGRIFMPGGERDRDHLDYRYDRNIYSDGRKVESSRIGKRRRDSPFNSSDNLLYIEKEENDRRCIKQRLLPFHSYQEPTASGRELFQGAAGPETGILKRNVRGSWKEMHIKSRRYSTNIATFDKSEGLRYHHPEDDHGGTRDHPRSTDTYAWNKSNKGHHSEDCFVQGRRYEQHELLHSRGEIYKSRQQDDTMFHNEGPSYHFERISGNNEPDYRRAFDCVAELVDERDMGRNRFRRMQEEDHSNQFGGSLFIQPDSRAQMHPRSEVDPCLVVVGKECTLQSLRRTCGAGVDKHHSRHDFTEWNDNQKPESSQDLANFNPEKAVLTSERKVDTDISGKNRHDKSSGNLQNDLDIEEGQIITEEINEDSLKRVDMTHINEMECPETASKGNAIVEILGDQKIQEIMAKMERRRERFKEPITSNRDCAKTPNSKHLPDLDVETATDKLERPARKRRWL